MTMTMKYTTKHTTTTTTTTTITTTTIPILWVLIIITMLLLECNNSIMTQIIQIPTVLLPIVAVTAQESAAPYFQTEIFNRNVKFRQSVCDRQQKYDSGGGSMPLEYALEGLRLRTILGQNEYFWLDSTGKIPKEPDYPGLMVVLLDELASRGKFTWRDSFATYPNKEELMLLQSKLVVEEEEEEGEGSSSSSSTTTSSNSTTSQTTTRWTWTDLLLWTADTYDLTVDWWIHTADRVSRGIAYPQPWFDANLIMVGMKQEQDEGGGDNDGKINLWGWLEPFSLEVWWTILATLVFSGLIYVLLDIVDPLSDQRKIHQKPIETIFMTAMGFTGHMEFVPQTIPSRLFTFSVAMWALLMSAAYTANLASFLVVRNTEGKAPVTTLDAVVRNGDPICVLTGASSEEQLRRDFPNANLVALSNEVDIFHGVIDGQCRVAVSYMSSWEYVYENDSEVNENCELMRVGQSYQQGRGEEAGFATKADSGSRCTSLIKDVINLHLLRMKQDGFIHQAWDEYSRRTKTADCSVPTTTSTAAAGSGSSSSSRTRFLTADEGGGGGSTTTSTNDEAETTETSLDAAQLTIKNMGGIFLLHASLSMFAVVFALVHRWFGLTARRNKEREKKNLRRHLKKIQAERALRMSQTPSEKRKNLLRVIRYSSAYPNNNGVRPTDTNSTDDLCFSDDDDDCDEIITAEEDADYLEEEEHSTSLHDVVPQTNLIPATSAMLSVETMNGSNSSLIYDHFHTMNARQEKQMESVDELKQQMKEMKDQMAIMMKMMAENNKNNN